MTGRTEILTQSVVVFSQNYLPITKVHLKKAIVLLLTGKAEPLDLWTGVKWQIRSPSIILEVPGQIRLLLNHGEKVWKVPPVTRKEILKRDQHQCQYCGSGKNLTIDHIIPRSKGGKHSWENVVIACQSCNGRKGDRTPTQAKMTLAKVPKAPQHPALALAAEFWSQQQLNQSRQGD